MPGYNDLPTVAEPPPRKRRGYDGLPTVRGYDALPVIGDDQRVPMPPAPQTSPILDTLGALVNPENDRLGTAQRPGLLAKQVVPQGNTDAPLPVPPVQPPPSYLDQQRAIFARQQAMLQQQPQVSEQAGPSFAQGMKENALAPLRAVPEAGIQLLQTAQSMPGSVFATPDAAQIAQQSRQTVNEFIPAPETPVAKVIEDVGAATIASAPFLYAAGPAGIPGRVGTAATAAARAAGAGPRVAGAIGGTAGSAAGIAEFTAAHAASQNQNVGEALGELGKSAGRLVTGQGEVGDYVNGIFAALGAVRGVKDVIARQKQLRSMADDVVKTVGPEKAVEIRNRVAGSRDPAAPEVVKAFDDAMGLKTTPGGAEPPSKQLPAPKVEPPAVAPQTVVGPSPPELVPPIPPPAPVAPATQQPPTLTRARASGSMVLFSVDSAGNVPDAAKIKSDLADLGYDVEVTKFKTDVISGLRGSTNYRIDVFENGALSSKRANDLAQEMAGGKDFSSPSSLEEKYTLDERFQALSDAIRGGKTAPRPPAPGPTPATQRPPFMQPRQEPPNAPTPSTDAGAGPAAPSSLPHPTQQPSAKIPERQYPKPDPLVQLYNRRRFYEEALSRTKTQGQARQVQKTLDEVDKEIEALTGKIKAPPTLNELQDNLDSAVKAMRDYKGSDIGKEAMLADAADKAAKAIADARAVKLNKLAGDKPTPAPPPQAPAEGTPAPEIRTTGQATGQAPTPSVEPAPKDAETADLFPESPQKTDSIAEKAKKFLGDETGAMEIPKWIQRAAEIATDAAFHPVRAADDVINTFVGRHSRIVARSAPGKAFVRITRDGVNYAQQQTGPLGEQLRDAESALTHADRKWLHAADDRAHANFQLAAENVPGQKRLEPPNERIANYLKTYKEVHLHSINEAQKNGIKREDNFGNLIDVAPKAGGAFLRHPTEIMAEWAAIQHPAIQAYSEFTASLPGNRGMTAKEVKEYVLFRFGSPETREVGSLEHLRRIPDLPTHFTYNGELIQALETDLLVGQIAALNMAFRRIYFAKKLGQGLEDPAKARTAADIAASEHRAATREMEKTQRSNKAELLRLEREHMRARLNAAKNAAVSEGSAAAALERAKAEGFSNLSEYQKALAAQVEAARLALQNARASSAASKKEQLAKTVEQERLPRLRKKFLAAQPRDRNAFDNLIKMYFGRPVYRLPGDPRAWWKQAGQAGTTLYKSLQTSLSAIAQLPQGLQTMHLAGPKAVLQGFFRALSHPQLSVKEAIQNGAFARDMIDWTVRPGRKFLDVVRIGGGVLTTPFRWSNQWARAWASEIAMIRAKNLIRYGNISPQEAKYLGLPRQVVEAINSGKAAIGDSNYKTIVQKITNASPGSATEPNFDRAFVTNSPVLSGAMGYMIYAGEAARASAWTASTLLKAINSGKPKDIYFALKTAMLLIVGAGVAGTLVRMGKNVATGKPVMDDKNFGELFAQGLYDSQISGTNRILDSMEYGGNNFDRVAMGAVPGFSFVRDTVGAALGFGPYKDYPFFQRIGKGLEKNTPMWKALHRHYDNIFGEGKKMDAIGSIRDKVREFVKEQPDYKDSGSGDYVINPERRAIRDALWRQELNEARKLVSEFRKANPGKDAVQSLRQTLMNGRPINLSQEKRRKFLQSLPADQRNEYFKIDSKYENMVNQLTDTSSSPPTPPKRPEPPKPPKR